MVALRSQGNWRWEGPIGMKVKYQSVSYNYFFQSCQRVLHIFWNCDVWCVNFIIVISFVSLTLLS